MSVSSPTDGRSASVSSPADPSVTVSFPDGDWA
jgi:hypothetical protein